MDMLIGVDNYYNIVHPGFIKEGSLVLIPTKCGYALSGSYKGTSNEAQVEIVTILRVGTDPIQTFIKEEEFIPCTSDLAKLWDLDHIGISPKEVKAENRETMRSFDDTINFDQEKGQYIVSLPWKANKHLLPNNFGVALGRMRGLQRKFIGDHGLGEHYQHIIEEQKERGFIEQVESRLDDCHYLPHHGVSKDSLTTPIRVVFDCSAKKSDKSLSLNDCLHTGPTLVPDLAKVLLRFRCNKYAWVSDIEKAFLMVKLNEADRDYTRFLWPRDPYDLTSPFDIYRFTVVLFGATCSPFLLNATILQHLSHSKVDEEVVEEIRRGLYIDNLQGTANGEEELIQQCWSSLKIFNQAHLYLREWATNSIKLRQQLSNDGLAAENQEVVKTLGLRWNTESDTIRCPSKSNRVTASEVTKRQCLSITAQLFDPLGVLLPVTIKSRMFLQNLWRYKVGFGTN
ncbi:MAG: hypothetical protein GY775_16540 [Candidatus Scalindua sp.]|nr:hypothetical protein [Candidatus Scalindua sp.]